jgi:hypothetical protein
MYKILRGKKNKKAQYAHRYANSVIVDLEKTQDNIVKVFKNVYFCKDFDNNWRGCSADSEADNPVNENLSKLLEEYFYKEAA